jgi:hypothetical protein
VSERQRAVDEDDPARLVDVGRVARLNDQPQTRPMTTTEPTVRSRRRRPPTVVIALVAIALVVVAIFVVATIRSRVEGRGVLAVCGPSQLVIRLDGTDFVVVSLPYGYLYDHAEHVVMVSRQLGHPESYDRSYDDVAHVGDAVFVKGTTLDGYGDPPPCSTVHSIRVESIVPA